MSLLRQHFEGNVEGPGINKWLHYFDIYDRHFDKFRGGAVNVLEVGVYGGGSLTMWRDYFGNDARVWGVDINPWCKQCEAERIEVLIGDAGSDDFWKDTLPGLPPIDVFIDDGSHKSEEQIVAAGAVWHHMRPGGVMVIEDIHGHEHGFNDELDKWVRRLNINKPTEPDDFQARVDSLHCYPYLAVLELVEETVERFDRATKGATWPPGSNLATH